MICRSCPRGCGGERDATRGGGFCGMPLLPVVARAALHQWEEPCISGARGSGTVFFSGCSLGCVYCQNRAISQENFGERISKQRLGAIFTELIDEGAENINLVNPSHFFEVLEEILCQPLPVPVVWNSGGYDRAETVRRLKDKVQIWLPDLKYITGERAARYSGAEDYPAVATRAILEMAAVAGPCVLEDGRLKRGVLIRHLLLPGGLQEAKLVMDWVREAFPSGAVLFSLMSQYTKGTLSDGFPELDRPLRPSEARAATEYMQALGLEGYTQDLAAADCRYVPSFDLTGVKLC